MPNGLKHQLVITVQYDEVKGSKQAQERLIRWIETYGHTSVSFGFEFVGVGRIVQPTYIKDGKATQAFRASAHR